MVKDDKRGHRSWWWMLPGAAGLAFIMMAILLWSSGPGSPGAPVAQANGDTATPTATATRTPTATPTVNPDCELKVTKSDSPDPVDTDGEITYTITVKNDADTNGVCDGFEVTDTIPDNTECVSIDVTDDDAATVDEDTGASDCDDAGEGDEVGWDSTDDLNDGDSVVLELVVELTSGADDGDTIENEACATSDDDEQGDCETEKTKVDEDVVTATKTPTPGPTATVGPTATARPVVPPVVAPAPPAPSAGLAPTLVAPITGTGTAAGGSLPLALALGLAGGCLLLLGGVAMLRRPR